MFFIDIMFQNTYDQIMIKKVRGKEIHDVPILMKCDPSQIIFTFSVDFCDRTNYALHNVQLHTFLQQTCFPLHQLSHLYIKILTHCGRITRIFVFFVLEFVVNYENSRINAMVFNFKAWF